MSKLFDNRKLKFLLPLTVAIVLVVAVVIVVLSGAFVGNPSTETENDLQINVGSSYPGMIDIVSASIAKNQDTLDMTINVKDPIIALGERESAQFDAIVILENEEETLQTYELRIDINATGKFCLVQDVQTKNHHPAQFSADDKTLTITATLSEMNDATKAEWNIYSTYEKVLGNQIISSAHDFVPDEGLMTTNFSAD